MLKNNIKKRNIVSKIFDTINKISTSACETELDTESEAESEAEPDQESNIQVTIPNHKTALKFKKIKPIVICMYEVRYDGLIPYILFLFHIKKDDEVGFTSLPTFNGSIKNNKIKYAAVSYMKCIFPESTISYKGFYESSDKNIIIVNSLQKNILIDTTNEYIWATSFEVINNQKIMNYSFDKSVLTFFQMNPLFLQLKTSENVLYESPMIGYYVIDSNTLTTLEEVDIYREIIIPALGKCYYLRMEVPDSLVNKYVMRIVFFAGRMILYENKNKNDNCNSILCREHKRYVINNYNQHVVLSAC